MAIVGTGEKVQAKHWVRPYGIPYAVLPDGREVHADQLNEAEPCPPTIGDELELID